MKTVIECDKGKELIKLGFRPNMFIDNEHANNLYHHMNKNNMIFLKDSYGTIVNEDFSKFFKKSDARKPYNELKGYMGYYTDHINLLYSKDYKLYSLTSSPYRNIFAVIFYTKNDFDNMFLINPLFLVYYGFICGGNYNCNLAYVYDKYLDDFMELAGELKEYYDMEVFVKLGE